MNYEIKVDVDKRLVVYTHLGLASRKSVGEAWLEILNLPEIKAGKFNIFTNYLDCEFDFSWSDADVILSFLGKHEQVLSGKRQAIVIANPVSTAISILFQSPLHEKFSFSVEVFSTIEAALIWLDVD